MYDANADLKRVAEQLTADLQQYIEKDWATQTPAVGWTVRHQVAHLTNVFGLATAAVATPEDFKKLLAMLSDDFEANVNAAMQPLLDKSNTELMQTWEHEVDACLTAVTGVALDQVVPWLVNPIPVGVLIEAGVTEMLAHGQDVRDALNIEFQPEDTVRAGCEFGFHTRTFGYLARGEEPPGDVRLRFELTAPSGESWMIGTESTDDVISGNAWDFVLLITRRRHPADLSLEGSTDFARSWMQIAQAYRGGPGAGRQPRQFAS